MANLIDMTDDTLLSNLCGICNATKAKYQCPACAARTCSLPCYKRHQQRALCTGKRDPTKYVKKSQLATPAGIDHDFNFITGIERELEKAERDVNERGLGATSDPQSRPRKGQLTKGQLRNSEYEAAGVRVIRAPTGLSRQKENKTHRSGKGKIVWTVEWIREDKTRLLTECTSAVPLHEIQPFPIANKKSKKRGKTTNVPSGNQCIESQDPSTFRAIKSRRIDVAKEGLELPSPEQISQTIETVAENLAAISRKSDSDPQTAHTHHSSLHLDELDSEAFPLEFNFFLSRPQTSSSRHVLVPISTSTTLAQCLRGRTVLEFPTIYAFPNTISQLPEGFMLEEEYLKQEGEEHKEFQDLLKHAHPEILRTLREDGNDGDEKIGNELDSRRILDVLKQDLGGLM